LSPGGISLKRNRVQGPEEEIEEEAQVMEFSWPEEAEVATNNKESEIKGEDLPFHENLAYGSELFESFFSSSELDYLIDLPVSQGSNTGESFCPSALMSEEGLLGLEQAPFLVKNEPSSPPSEGGRASPSSPGESSGPSSPETAHLLLMETINPSAVLGQQFGARDVKMAPQGTKRSRFVNEEEEDAMPPTPTNATPDEERQFKRQRRLIKNRESAQKSRMRKKMYIEDLEAKVRTLTAQQDKLCHENAALKEEISYLTRFINKTPGLAEEVAKGRPPKGAVAPMHNVKAAGVCLLVVLFSFGLMFNNVQQFGDKGPALPFETGMKDSGPAALPFGSEKRNLGHMLKSLKDAPNLQNEDEDMDNNLTQIYPKRRLPPLDTGGLDAVIQRNKVARPSCTEVLDKGSLCVPQISSEDFLSVEDHLHQGPRNDTGAEDISDTC
jgi:hypothetical protein